MDTSDISQKALDTFKESSSLPKKNQTQLMMECRTDPDHEDRVGMTKYIAVVHPVEEAGTFRDEGSMFIKYDASELQRFSHKKTNELRRAVLSDDHFAVATLVGRKTHFDGCLVKIACERARDTSKYTIAKFLVETYTEGDPDRGFLTWIGGCGMELKGLHLRREMRRSREEKSNLTIEDYRRSWCDGLITWGPLDMIEKNMDLIVKLMISTDDVYETLRGRDVELARLFKLKRSNSSS